MWGCSSRLLPLALGVGLLFLAATRDLRRGVAPPAAIPGLGRGVSPLYLLPTLAPDLGHGAAPLSRSCAITAWHSRLLSLTLDMG